MQVSPHVNAPLARVARNRGVSEDAYMKVDFCLSCFTFCSYLLIFLFGAAHRFRDQWTRRQGADCCSLMDCGTWVNLLQIHGSLILDAEFVLGQQQQQQQQGASEGPVVKSAFAALLHDAEDDEDEDDDR